MGLRLIEFFSGIGGMRLGVEQALPSGEVLEACHAYEIAANANAIYLHNFPQEGDQFTLTCQQIERLESVPEADIWTLSPPCQPFTRKPGAKHLDMEDSRCLGLKGIMRLLPGHQPRWIVLENVKGFVGSQMLEAWKECLRDCGYSWKEYLLSPTQFGIPNHRTRYYIICEHSDRFVSNDGMIVMGPNLADVEMKTIADYMEGDNIHESLLVPEDVLQQPWAKELDIVDKNDTITHCFTSSYGRIYHPASGSLLFYDDCLRRFSPKEVANMLCFPKDYSFPSDLAIERQYKHICNAVNVTVVEYLVRELMSHEPLLIS
jgi:tRNA (cytosine38-C5)-methyltransferase